MLYRALRCISALWNRRPAPTPPVPYVTQRHRGALPTFTLYSYVQAQRQSEDPSSPALSGWLIRPSLPVVYTHLVTETLTSIKVSCDSLAVLHFRLDSVGIRMVDGPSPSDAGPSQPKIAETIVQPLPGSPVPQIYPHPPLQPPHTSAFPYYGHPPWQGQPWPSNSYQYNPTYQLISRSTVKCTLTNLLNSNNTNRLPRFLHPRVLPPTARRKNLRPRERHGREHRPRLHPQKSSPDTGMPY